MQLKANPVKLKDFLSDGPYLVPFYQRGYEWGLNELNALLDDIARGIIHQRPLFIGTISVVDRMKKGSKGKATAIVDGQQRVVTFLMLISKLRQIASQNKEPSPFDSLANKLPLTFEANDELQTSMGSVWSWTTSNQVMLRRHANRIADWIEELRRDDTILPREISDWVNEKVIAVVVRHELDPIDEIGLFQSLNARGMPLSDFDLIRSLLGMNLAPGATAEQVIRNFDSVFRDIHWKVIKEARDAKGNEWKEDFKDFLENYIAFETFSPLKPFGSFRVYRNFELHYRDSLRVKAEFERCIANWSKFFAAYLQIRYKTPDSVGRDPWMMAVGSKINFLPFVFSVMGRADSGYTFSEHSKKWSYEDSAGATAHEYYRIGIGLFLKVLSVQGTGQSDLPYWLALSESVSDPKITPDKLMISLRGGDTFGTYSNIQDKVFSDVFNRPPLLPKITEGFVWILSDHAIRSSDNNEKIELTKPTIEHILPQTPSKESGLVNDEEYKRHLNMIGNLCLLTQKSNSRGGNESFDEKKNRVYLNSVSPLVTGKGLNLPPLSSYRKFGFAEIEERSRRIGAKIVEILSIESVKPRRRVG